MIDFNEFSRNLSESKKIVVKRQYTENHPAITIGFAAKVRNKILSTVGTTTITSEDFEKLVSEFSKSAPKWISRNSRYFNVSEDGVSLSKIGSRALSVLNINEEESEEEITESFMIAEGQFSWMTQDTEEQIGSDKENTIDVWMYDNRGNSWFEGKYEGYGEFGGMDYYELLARMNGYSEEDLEDKSLTKKIKMVSKSLRDFGIAIAFGSLETRDKGKKPLFPALVTTAKYNWKRHDFTKEAASDPNQSWYTGGDEDYYDDYDGYDESKICEARVEMDAVDPDDKDFLKFLKKNRVKITDKMMDGPGGGHPVITMQGKRKDLEKVLSDCDYGWCDDGLAEYIEESAINEGIHPKIKKAIKAVEKGETVYGENIRFPGRFKIIEFSPTGSMATVDYEDGKGPMDMVSMNIKLDSLQFESVTTEGRAFVAAAKKAKDDGDKEFEFDGKKYPVTIKEDRAVSEGKEEKEAKNILLDLLGEYDPWELADMLPDDARETVATYGHKGAKAEKIATALLSMAQNGEFESKRNKKEDKFIYESFKSYVQSLSNNTVNEAFKSSKLQSILAGAKSMPKNLAKSFYSMSKLQLDKIEDIDIIEMDPISAKKEKRNRAVYFYFTTNEKENPYAKSYSYGVKSIPGNTLLAMTDGKNQWLSTGWMRGESTVTTSKRDDSIGFSKSSTQDEWGSGISSLTKVAELADRAYVLDLDVLDARYSSSAKRTEREQSKKGAIAFKSDKDFRKENKDRYHTILANRAAQMPIDAEVLKAIDVVAEQIKNGIANKETSKYGEPIIGTDPKGRSVSLRDASNAMSNLLDDFRRYVDYTNNAEQEKNAGYEGSYYEREVKNYAKSIKDRIKKIQNMDYVW